MAVGVLKDEASKELDKFINNLQGKKEFTDSMNQFLDRVRKNIDEYDFNASGNLRQSLKVLPQKQNPKGVTVRIEIEDYWQDLETGTKPKGFNKENVKKLQPKILQWIRDKESLSSIATTEWRKRAFSFLITRSILKKGTIKRFGYKGKPFLTQEIPQLEKDINNEIRK